MRSVDSRKARWHPSPQLMRVLCPLGETMSMDGLESIVDVVSILTDAVIIENEFCQVSQELCSCREAPVFIFLY